MDFREITYILAIAKYQSLSKAADSLYVSQPTLTKFLQKQEKELGQPLFRRLGNRFLLTYAGERYVTEAKRILEIKESLDKELLDIKKDSIGVLKVGIPLMRSPRIIPRVLPPFQKLFPNVEVSLIEEDSATLESKVHDGEIDVAFFSLSHMSSDLEYELIGQEELLLALSVDNPLCASAVKRENRRYPYLDLKLAENESFILAGNLQHMGDIAMRIFQNEGIKPRVVLRTRNRLTALELTAQGYGCTFTMASNLAFTLFRDRINCYSVGQSIQKVDFVAAYRQGIYIPNYLRCFITLIRDSFEGE